MPKGVYLRGPSRAVPRTCRRLRSGEPIPETKPGRYTDHYGYIYLRWRMGVGTYVEALEHRVAGGFIVGAPTVHHKNRQKADNRPANLLPTDRTSHAAIHSHWTTDIDGVAKLYASGLSTLELGRMFGVNHSNIWRALRRRGFQTRRRGELTPHNRQRISEGQLRRRAAA